MTVLLLAVAIVLVPAQPARRIGVGTPPRNPAVFLPIVSALAVPVVLATDRLLVVLAAAIACATAIHTLVRSQRKKAATLRLEATATYLGHLVAALRAGSTVADASARAVNQLPDATPAELTRELERAAAHLRRGGNGASILAESHLDELRDVGALWGLSARLGIPMADLLESARSRIDNALRHRQATNAALAGPRATAVVLSVLPLAGILMGQAMGARPIALLTGGGFGSLLLLGGTALVCAGFYTSQFIIGRAAA